MRIIKIAVLLFMPFFLSACAETLPVPGTGITLAKMPSICSAVNQRFDENFPGYYVKSQKESIMVEKCHFTAADVYFSRTPWSSLKKILAEYPSNTAIRPMFSDPEEPHIFSFAKSSVHAVNLFSLGANNGYFMLGFKGYKWQKRPVATGI